MRPNENMIALTTSSPVVLRCTMIVFQRFFNATEPILINIADSDARRR